jgi:hypothetical protein
MARDRVNSLETVGSMDAINAEVALISLILVAL